MNFILHIGQPKTGTSSLQRFLYHNKHLLESMGYYYHTYDEGMKDTTQGSLLTQGAFDFYNHSDQMLKLLVNPLALKQYIETLIINARKKNLHTIILSSELLFEGVFTKQHILNLIKVINSPVKAVLFLKRPDLYIESMWQQWYFKDFDSFDMYLKNKIFPPYYPQISFWNKIVNELNVIPFEKRYFPDGLEKLFLNILGINEYKKFDFDYISSNDNWGYNKGLTSSALEIIMKNKNLTKKYNDTFILHKFFTRYLNSLFQKEHGKEYDFLTYEQRLEILKKHEASLHKIGKEFLNTSEKLFEMPQRPTTDKFEKTLNDDMIINKLLDIGITQDTVIQKLNKKIEVLETALKEK
jgi:hypothetical protein